MQQILSAQNNRSAVGGADKAICALGGGILGAGVGIGAWGVILGCIGGYFVGQWAEKKSEENAVRGDF